MLASHPFDDAHTWLARLTLEQKAGQVLAIDFEGPHLSADVLAMVEQQHAGGVIFFTRNVEAPGQVARLTAELQQAARRAGQPGLLLAIDQEGGRVARLTESAGFTAFPSAMALAATGQVHSARRAARAMAAEMKAVGLNADFAPVLDVNNNPANPIIGTRSFGADPGRVAEFGVAFLQELQAAGVLAIGKHFPGHGDTATDSHLSLPSVTHDRARLEAVELVPFRAAIAAGVAGLMAAHIAFPALDPSRRPASLSDRILTGLLRDELGFTGLLATDSLEMGALSGTLGLDAAQAAAAALAAGADMLLFNCGHAQQREAHALIVERVKSGSVPLARLDQAVLRVLKAKARAGLLEPADAAGAQLSSGANRALAEELAAQSITLLRDEAAWLPLPRDARPIVLEGPALAGLAQMLGAEPGVIEAVDPDGLAQSGRPCVVGIAEIARFPGQKKIVTALMEAKARVILVAARDPYDLLAFPGAPCMLATYGAPPPTLRALAAVLRGHARPSGRLPVELPGLFGAGSGLARFAIRK